MTQVVASSNFIRPDEIKASAKVKEKVWNNFIKSLQAPAEDIEAQKLKEQFITVIKTEIQKALQNKYPNKNILFSSDFSKHITHIFLNPHETKVYLFRLDPDDKDKNNLNFSFVCDKSRNLVLADRIPGSEELKINIEIINDNIVLRASFVEAEIKKRDIKKEKENKDKEIIESYYSTQKTKVLGQLRS